MVWHFGVSYPSHIRTLVEQTQNVNTQQRRKRRTLSDAQVTAHNVS